MRRLNWRSEDGATAVVVALLMVVLFGFAAFAVDAGALYQERRELQNGADAAAFAVGEDCAEAELAGSPCTVAGVEPTAGQYAEANASDAAADADVALDLANRAATITTATRTAEGNGALAHWFAPIIGIDDTRVQARATVQWGVPMQAEGFPLAICDGEFPLSGLPAGEQLIVVKPGGVGGGGGSNGGGNGTAGNFSLGGEVAYSGHGGDHTGGGQRDDHTDDTGGVLPPPPPLPPAPPPPAPPPPPPEPTGPCDLNASGIDLPGGFGWLRDLTGDSCSATISQGNAYVDPGNNVPQRCRTELETLRDAIDACGGMSPCVAAQRLMPVYDETSGAGINGTYHIAGFAVFEFTGFFFQSYQAVHAPSGNPPCGPGPGGSPQSCIRGEFVQYVTLDALSVDPDAPNTYGVLAVELID